MVAGDVPLALVIANRSYEAWVLASRAALFRCTDVRRDAPLSRFRDPEAAAGTKRVLSDFIGERYSPPIHQPKLTEVLSFSPASQRRAPSLAKLIRELQRLTKEARSRP